MKVLFISSGNSKVGINPIVKAQGESLKNNGLDLDYFAIKGKGFKGYFKNIPKLIRYLKTYNFDIVHSHYVFCGWVALLAYSHIPIVVSYMGSDTYGDVDINGKITKRSYINIFLAKVLQPFVDAIIVKSKNLESYIYLKGKAYIIPNGADFKKFYPIDMGECRRKICFSTEKKIILFLGDPQNERKNFNLLEKAYKLLVNKIEDLVLLNPFPIKSEEVPFYMNAADVLVMTSYLEGSPNVIKEAMACKLPIVSTDVGDVKEVIGNTKGCYITSFEPKDVAEKIQKALELGKRTNGRENIKHLDINNIARRIISVYQRVLNEK